MAPGRIERPILWLALMGPTGSGKSPAQGLAFGHLKDRDATVGDQDGRLLLDDSTIEALARELDALGGAATVEADELEPSDLHGFPNCLHCLHSRG